MLKALVFDVGGTKMRLALLDISEGQCIISKINVIKTPQNFDEAMSSFGDVAKKMFGKKEIAYAVGGTPGPFNANRTRIVNAPNLKGWNNKPLKKCLEKNLRCRVIIENDADLAGLGEAFFGAGKGFERIAYFTVSTGVGGTLIAHRRVIRGLEPGHQMLDYKKILSLENLVSGTGIRKRTGKNPPDINDRVFWNNQAKILAVGIHNTIVHWSPDVVILGGLVMKSLPIKEVRNHLKNIMKIFRNIPKVELAKLKDNAGIYGAMALIQNKIKRRKQ